MMRAARIGTAIAALALGACSALSLGPTRFEPAHGGAGQPGYTVERTEQDHFHVAFSGNSSTSRRTVEDSLAYLAAEVTLRNGGDYFTIAKAKSERTSSAFYGNSYVRDPAAHCCHWDGVVYHEYEAEADIVIFKGTVPQDDPSVHDARAIVEDLGPSIRRGGGFSVY
jgi:hypothetical protein